MRLRGLLVDINGTLTDGDEPVPGAVEAMRRVKEAGLAVRYTSNIDSRPSGAVSDWISSLGFPVEEVEVFTPTIAAARRLAGMRCHALVNRSVISDLVGVEILSAEAGEVEAVLIGDVRDDFTYANLDVAFGYLARGAELFALQKNRYRQNSEVPGGVSLDTGAFVAALEYASGRQATVFGKPEKPFFDLALEDLGLGREEVAVVGDDPHSDVGGSRSAGMISIQVKTGKYEPEEESGADHTIKTFADIPELLGL